MWVCPKIGAPRNDWVSIWLFLENQLNGFLEHRRILDKQGPSANRVQGTSPLAEPGFCRKVFPGFGMSFFWGSIFSGTLQVWTFIVQATLFVCVCGRLVFHPKMAAPPRLPVLRGRAIRSKTHGSPVNPKPRLMKRGRPPIRLAFYNADGCEIRFSHPP